MNPVKRILGDRYSRNKESDEDIFIGKFKISQSDDGYWVVYGPGMPILGQGFEDKDRAIKFVNKQ